MSSGKSAAPPAKKSKFSGSSKPNKFYKNTGGRTFLEVGCRGFLATTNFREKECVRECYNILNSYANELYGAEALDFVSDADKEDTTIGNADKSIESVAEHKQEATTNQSAAAAEDDPKAADDDDDQEEDIATTLAHDIEAANALQARSNRRRRFHQVMTGASNCIFIKTALQDPVRLAAHIVRDVAQTRKHITRNVLRFVPVEAVCKANVADIKNAAGPLFDRHFLNQPATSYSVVYNKRCNNDLDRDEIIRELAQLVDSKGADHKVNLKAGKVAVLVEIVKGLCCLSVVPDYMQMKKYNLAELVAPTSNAAEKEVEKNATSEEKEPVVVSEEKIEGAQ